MLLVRKVRMLWLLVVLVVTPVITLPWNILGKSIVQQQEEDDDDGGDDGEKVAACASVVHQGRSPRLASPRRHRDTRPPQRLMASRKLPLRSVASACSDFQSTRVRLQI